MPASQAATAAAAPTSRKRPAPRGTAAYPRKRAVKACQVCRARRTKCDNLKPSCSFCLKVGAKCIQSLADLSSFDPASLRILERLDDLEQILRDKSNTISGTPTSKKRHSTSLPDRNAGDSIESSSNVEQDTRSSRLLPGLVEEVIAWPEFDTGLEPVPPLMGAFQSRPSDGMSDGLTTSQIYELEPQSAKSLLDRFFTHTHVKNPVLDEVHTRQLVSRLALHGIDWSPQSCLALLVCALGSLAAPVTGDEEVGYGVTPTSPQYLAAQSFFQAAQKRLGICLTNGDIISTQCLFLSGVYMITIFKPIEAWRLFLQALSNCQTLDFLSRGNQSKPFSHSINVGSPETPRTAITSSSDGHTRYAGQTLEHAIYWSAWKSEIEMRFELQPQDFKLPYAEKHSYPPFFPCPPEISDDDPSIEGLTSSEQRGWFFYLSEISLRRLMSRIRSEILSFDNWGGDGVDILETLAGSVEEYEMQAKTWYDALPDAVTFQDAAVIDDICRFVLRGHYNNLYEMIYWPFVDAAIHYQSHGPIPVEPQDTTPTAGTNLLNLAYKGLVTHVNRIQNDSCGYRHRHHGTLPMVRSNTRSALVLLSAAFSLSDREREKELGPESPMKSHDWRFSGLSMPPGWQAAVNSVFELNRYWQNEAQDIRWRMGSLERVYQKARDMGILECEDGFADY